MKQLHILSPANTIDMSTWLLRGSGLTESEKRLAQLEGVFTDTAAYRAMDPGTLVYSVQAHLPVAEGTPGGLFFGSTIIEPGRVGAEFFMTRGHFHAQADRAEYYWGVKGDGVLILMNASREVWAERMFPGSLHYIRGGTAHRVANTGTGRLIFGASWPSDAGHDYESISRNGFSARLIDRAGTPTLIPE
jgi:glucose-6-phosphate isomerase